MSCYAGMKYLGKDLPALEWVESDTALILYPTGDPTFLHPDYVKQPVADFITECRKAFIYKQWRLAVTSAWQWLELG